jgi:branched-chain amino acid transport system permease protein
MRARDLLAMSPKELQAFLVAVALIAAVPKVASEYYAYLLLTALAWGIVLLGYNLLFGYTGLLSFGHAMFVAVGAYAAAYLTSVFNVRYMEAIILTAMAAAFVISLGIGYICVKYTRIHFAMLTLSFGMLMYAVLLKFYYYTGGDEGMPVYRPLLLGFRFDDMTKIRLI